MVCSNKLVVGIFSREGSSTYQWLIDLLLSAEFDSLVRDVRPVAITNTGSLDQEIASCSFAILYHSKSRGRLNITDVTDSLYDQELRELSTSLGREKVLVLVDDLDDADVGAHGRITLQQPLIAELAGLMVIFYRSDKPLHSSAGEEGYGSIIGCHRGLDSRVKMNIDSMKDQMSSGSSSVLCRGCENTNWVRVLLIGGFLVFIVVLIVVVCLEFIPR